MHKFTIMFLYFLLNIGSLHSSIERQNILDLIEDAKKIEIEYSDKKLSPKAKAENERIKEKVISRIDLEVMTRKTLGKHYSKLTKKQEEEFKDLFKRLMIQNFSRSSGGASDKGNNFFDNYRVRVLDKVEIKGTRLLVKSILSKRGHENTEINYVFENRKIVDLLIDEESLTENFYEQFSEVISEKGIDGLLKLMEENISSKKN